MWTNHIALFHIRVITQLWIKYYDCILKVTWHVLANQSALFHFRVITLVWNKAYCWCLTNVTLTNQSALFKSRYCNYSTLNKVLWLYIASHMPCVNQSEVNYSRLDKLLYSEIFTHEIACRHALLFHHSLYANNTKHIFGMISAWQKARKNAARSREGERRETKERLRKRLLTLLLTRELCSWQKRERGLEILCQALFCQSDITS